MNVRCVITLQTHIPLGAMNLVCNNIVSPPRDACPKLGVPVHCCFPRSLELRRPEQRSNASDVRPAVGHAALAPTWLGGSQAVSLAAPDKATVLFPPGVSAGGAWSPFPNFIA